MGAELPKLHIAFLPLMAPGHTIPMLDIASLFSARGVKTTFITTPLNAPTISKSLENRTTNTTLEIFPFPSREAGLPEGVENLESATSFEMGLQFVMSLGVMKEPLEKFLSKTRPNCLVADMFFSFATEVAAKFGIPRLVFHGSSFFTVCVGEALRKYEPHSAVSSDDEYFTIPHLPHEIRFTKSQMVQEEKEGNNKDGPFKRVLNAIHEAEIKSFGVLFNSFYELERAYADHFRNVLGRRAWHIGPVSLCNQHIEEKSHRGKMAAIDKDDCLKWLDSKEPNSVIYVCFGSLTRLSPSQLYEIAMALEASRLDFIWVIPKRDPEGEVEDQEECLPRGFKKRVEGKGLIIRGWAPQVLILDHEGIGGFVTHCGWNSILECISAGVPMVTWPTIADQFYNEKLVTDVLRVGMQVGFKVWEGMKSVVLKRDEIEVALKRIMVGEVALEIRSRANNLKEMAWRAVEEGGSSFSQLSALIQELSHYRHNKLAC